MSTAFIQSVTTNLPDGANKIVFDRYHIMVHMQKAVDRTWKQENGALQAEGDGVAERHQVLLARRRREPPAET